jgi:hypothetical protein
MLLCILFGLVLDCATCSDLSVQGKYSLFEGGISVAAFVSATPGLLPVILSFLILKSPLSCASGIWWFLAASSARDGEQ